jgi:hypothetical protein
MSEKISDLNGDKLGEYFRDLEVEVEKLDKLNKSTDRSTDSIAAQQHGSKLLQILHAARLEILHYNYFMDRLNNGRK